MDARREHRGRGPKGYKRSDERIKEDVNDRLTDDYYLDASEIDVQVINGEVVLTGTVNSREDKRRAEDIAESVSGVINVEVRLRVQPQSSGATYASGQSSGTYGSQTGTTGTTSATGSTSSRTEPTSNSAAAAGAGTSPGSTSGTGTRGGRSSGS
ncbi:MAG TPA: BON domain-containing protein [Pyrinomonadaceae bacterium]